MLPDCFHTAMTALTVLAASPAEGLFDTVAGLPVHPLVVHAAVILLPLSAVGLIVIVLVPRWRRTFGWLVLAGLAAGAVAAFIAKESGEALAARVGEPADHAQLGDVLPLVAVLLLVAAAAWFTVDRRARSGPAGRSSTLANVLGAGAAVLAVATIALTVLVGHSGAEAVWAGRITATDAAATTPSPDSGAGPVAAGGITMTDVAAHGTPADCWAAIGGTVYDLTSWIDQHEGGAVMIEDLCGTDGTTSFTGEHSGEREPAERLASFAIGTLS